MPNVVITKTFRFEAAHALPGHPGKCSRLHGHSYMLEVSVAGDLGPDGMVMDFDDLSVVVERVVISRLDHTMLNDVVDNPTVENVVLNILESLNREGLHPTELTLHETATSRATVRP